MFLGVAVLYGGNKDFLASLKWLVRTGWMQSGVPGSIGETVAQHSFETAFLALDLSFRLLDQGVEVDPFKASVLGLVHDIAEAVVGDVPRWTSGMLGGGKEDLESKAVDFMPIHPRVRDLYREYLAMDSIESRIAKIADYLSTCIQSSRYMALGYDVGGIGESTRESMFEMIDACCRELKPYVESLCPG